MQFKTSTSTYDLNKNPDGTMTLEKVAIAEGCESKIGVGEKLTGMPVAMVRGHLLFLHTKGEMNTSKINDEDVAKISEFIESKNN